MVYIAWLFLEGLLLSIMKIYALSSKPLTTLELSITYWILFGVLSLLSYPFLGWEAAPFRKLLLIHHLFILTISFWAVIVYGTGEGWAIFRIVLMLGFLGVGLTPWKAD
jgi:hypothetical protein